VTVAAVMQSGDRDTLASKYFDDWSYGVHALPLPP
jgi:hypothetical protein